MHDAHFTALHVAQEARKAGCDDNLSFNVPVRQPAEQAPPPFGTSIQGLFGNRTLSAKEMGERVNGWAQPQPSKYRNVRTNGYASKREAKRAAELRVLEAAGVIRELTEQVPFLLIPKQEGERACWFVADFAFYEEPREPQQQGWQFVVADAKGFRTEVFKIKKKLMLLVHGIRVREL